MFLQWMKANKEYPEAKELTYVEFPQKFVWKEVEVCDDEKNGRKKTKKWCLRQCGMSVGRIFYVQLGVGELYYLKILLNTVKGPTCFEDIRTVNGVQYPTFKEACFVLGLLDDDKEYIDGIVEASF